MEAKVNLVYIAGVDRNGSTLLGRVLGEHANCVNVGEALNYMLNSKLRNRYDEQSAGTEFDLSVVPFWKKVYDITGFKFISNDVDDFINEYATTAGKLDENDATYNNRSQNIQKFITAVSTVSNAAFVIDSSKRPKIPLLFKNMNDVNVYIIHMIRNPDDIASSRSKKKAYLNKVPFLQMVGRWIRRNQLGLQLNKYYKYKMVSYDDFCANHYDFIKELLTFINCDSDVIPSLNKGHIKMHPQNIIAGNPDKFNEGEIEIVKRKSNNPFWKTAIIKTLTFPWLLKYKQLIN